MIDVSKLVNSYTSIEYIDLENMITSCRFYVILARHNAIPWRKIEPQSINCAIVVKFSREMAGKVKTFPPSLQGENKVRALL